MPSTARLLAAVALTWLVEWAVVALILRRLKVYDAMALLLINAATNPLANAAYNLGHLPPLAVEALVVAIEVPLYRLCIAPRWKSAAALALAANLASAVLSLVF